MYTLILTLFAQKVNNACHYIDIDLKFLSGKYCYCE